MAQRGGRGSTIPVKRGGTARPPAARGPGRPPKAVAYSAPAAPAPAERGGRGGGGSSGRVDASGAGAAYLESYVDTAAELPAQLQRNFNLMRELDQRWRGGGGEERRAARLLFKCWV